MKPVFLLFVVLSASNPTGFYGPYTPELFWSCIFFAFIGYFLINTADVATRDVHKPGTPVSFSWLTFIECNWIRFARNLFLIYISVRFCPELTGKDLSEIQAIVVGGAIDGVFVAYKKMVKAFKNRK